jgi:hypothetical protein
MGSGTHGTVQHGRSITSGTGFGFLAPATRLLSKTLRVTQADAARRGETWRIFSLPQPAHH